MKIVCIGDSLTEGDYGIKGKRCIANVHEKGYPYFLQKLTGAEVLNFGKCGYRSSDYLQFYLDGNVNVKDADIIIVMLGTNGGQSITENTNDNICYDKLIKQLKKDAAGAKIILCTPPHVTENPEYSNCGYIDNAVSATLFVRKYANENNITLLDINAYNEFCEETEHIYQANDGLHFVEAGYKKLAEFIYDFIEHV